MKAHNKLNLISNNFLSCNRSLSQSKLICSNDQLFMVSTNKQSFSDLNFKIDDSDLEFDESNDEFCLQISNINKSFNISQMKFTMQQNKMQLKQQITHLSSLNSKFEQLQVNILNCQKSQKAMKNNIQLYISMQQICKVKRVQ
ncbi:Hypothetical_protein [Hexamita inflata]|uniref:Hypothetical_protein n=1 Tax=Hexamita inflata TaxID=28002 RepID=A0AA86NNB7_9EUKA|nr:Hypothetical protein HINF_LOCUS9545 [Hexamita inflata]